jgi:spore coat polysaccharide biosynthesis protein SpsF
MNGTHLTPNRPDHPIFQRLGIYAFIQARLGSQRLPGKVMELLPFQYIGRSTNPVSAIPIESEASHWIRKPLLECIYIRLQRIFPPSHIVFVVPESDQKLIEYLTAESIPFFPGSEEDVRFRFQKAAKFYQANIIFRLTGDNPFPDIDAISSLLELWIQSSKTKIPLDCAYSGRLPLGMGVESFTQAALFREPKHSRLEENRTQEIQEVREVPKDREPPDRYREHVSLHIKEFPNEFTIRMISSGESQDLSRIRVTIDQDEDLETVCKIAENFLKNAPNKNLSLLDREDLLSIWEKSQFAPSNQGVEQVRFSIPPPIYPQKQNILLAAGSAKDFGSGHLSRIHILQTGLENLGYSVTLIHVSSMGRKDSPFEKNFLDKDFSLVILDARDQSYREWKSKFPDSEIWILDSFHSDRNLFPGQYIDVLPHPKLNNSKIPFLLSPFHSDLKVHKVSPESDFTKNEIPRVLIYAGSLENKICEALDQMVLSGFPKAQILRIGGTPSEVLPWILRVSKPQWAKLLFDTTYLVTYYGLSLFEGIFHGKNLSLYSISDYHLEMANWMASQLQIPVWNMDSGHLSNPIASQPNFANTEISLDFQGLEFLLDRIQRFLKLGLNESL